MSAFRPDHDSGNILGAVALEIPHTMLGMCSLGLTTGKSMQPGAAQPFCNSLLPLSLAGKRNKQFSLICFSCLVG
jgi:proteasome assembly chaperone (PAC2) family protein